MLWPSNIDDDDFITGNPIGPDQANFIEFYKKELEPRISSDERWVGRRYASPPWGPVESVSVRTRVSHSGLGR